jgi:hypothetical protein
MTRLFSYMEHSLQADNHWLSGYFENETASLFFNDYLTLQVFHVSNKSVNTHTHTHTHTHAHTAHAREGGKIFYCVSNCRFSETNKSAQPNRVRLIRMSILECIHRIISIRHIKTIGM